MYFIAEFVDRFLKKIPFFLLWNLNQKEVEIQKCMMLYVNMKTHQLRALSFNHSLFED